MQLSPSSCYIHSFRPKSNYFLNAIQSSKSESREIILALKKEGKTCFILMALKQRIRLAST